MECWLMRDRNQFVSGNLEGVVERPKSGFPSCPLVLRRPAVQVVPSLVGFASPLLIPRTPDRPYRSHLSPITLLSRHISFNFLTFTPSHHHPGLNPATTTEVCKLFCFPIIRNIPPVSNHIFSWCRPKTLFWLNQHVPLPVIDQKLLNKLSEKSVSGTDLLAHTPIWPQPRHSRSHPDKQHQGKAKATLVKYIL